MKKNFVSAFLLVQVLTFAQSGNENVSFSTGNFFMRGNRPSTKEYVIDGIPYPNGKQFDQVVIQGFSKNVQNLRYNAYDDEMEFKDKTYTYFTNKEEGLKIEFPSLKKVYKTLNYSIEGRTKFGYLVLLFENPKYSLYKREKIELLKGEKSPNAYGKDANDYYAKQKDIYLIENNKQFTKFPKNQKEFIEVFKLDNANFDTYVKTNKINFSKEEGMIKLIQYLNQF
ncbi:hypothetical protein EIB75_04410 [Epilithonimonas vandammei]|uniref:Uncharacterized protein n=1 Tax=Epilithonimonas vandammei TaxID=2487072 RepID=A0A3G8ZCM5_9FLAO|nr:hypothetical protein [Epilithonimonas vandammei]AZI54535.1 hypothetical protein EIB75_04410 [Epilithonimonas vandammei]